MRDLDEEGIQKNVPKIMSARTPTMITGRSVFLERGMVALDIYILNELGVFLNELEPGVRVFAHQAFHEIVNFGISL